VSERNLPPTADQISRYAPVAGVGRADLGPGRPPARGGGDSLVDLLDRVLDKGVVVAGDISISLLDIELLTIKIRLLIASVDKAREMGIDWWAHDPQLSAGARQRQQKLDAERENKELRERVGELESRLTALLEDRSGETARPRAAAGAAAVGHPTNAARKSRPD
jgi:hypothetical protein